MGGVTPPLRGAWPGRGADAQRAVQLLGSRRRRPRDHDPSQTTTNKSDNTDAMQYPSTDASPQPTIAPMEVPACMKVHPLRKAPKRGTYTAFELRTPIAKSSKQDRQPVCGHVWEPDDVGGWKLARDPKQSSRVLKFELAALSWLHAGGVADVQCASDAEPRCPVAVPGEVKRHFDRWMAAPVDRASVQCRSGEGGVPALTVALKLVHGARRAEFEAFDAACKQANLDRIARERANDANKGESDVGPSGETESTHDRVVTHEKCGGKGQTHKVVTWKLKAVDAADERGATRWPLDPEQRFFCNQPIHMM